MTRILAIVVCCGFVLAAALADDRPKVETFQGKVVSLADVLKKQGIELDADAGKHWLALATEDRKTYPLVKDAGARLFFRDPRLLNRPMRIQGRLVASGTLLQVLQVHSLKDGKPHEVFYWCDVCSIKRQSLAEKNVCECCGGPMELREVPVQK
jgi:hypothetical protein